LYGQKIQLYVSKWFLLDFKYELEGYWTRIVQILKTVSNAMNFISICFHLSNGVFDHIFHTILNNNTPKITHPYEIQVIDNHFEVKLSKKYN